MESVGWSNASLVPSALDLLFLVPRLAQRAGSYALFHMPEAVDNIAGKIFSGGSIIADATAQQTANSTITNTSSAVQNTGVAALDAAIREAFRSGDDAGTSMLATILRGVTRLKNFGGIFSYLTSRWALATFTAAIILNRTQFYASSREHLRLKWHMRLALYVIPISGFMVQLLYILQALKCQTSPDFSLLRYGDPLKYIAIDFGGEGGFLYMISSTLLFWQDDASCCAARSMSTLTVENDKTQLRGSMALLFHFFLTLCTSQLFETLACALEGRQPVPETGMTIFEHSLAFAECEAMISSALGFGFFGLSKSDTAGSPGFSETNGPLVSRAEIIQRLNVPPEVLLVCLISCFSHLSSSLLAVVGLRHKVRLVNTALWACCYISAFFWSFTKIFFNQVESVADLGVLRFPTVCIVGFIPHILVLLGILVCAIIYGLALLITALSVPEGVARRLTFSQRLSWAYRNLQANVHFSSSSNIRIRMCDDFYTTLLKVGFTLLTAASEAVYLNEGSQIHIAQMTWLEQKRVDELATEIDKRKAPAVPVQLLGEGIAKGVEFTDHHNSDYGRSPYARERRSKATTIDPERPNPGELDSGLGITQRRSRLQLTFDFLAGIFWMVVEFQASFTLGFLRKVGVEHRPLWLLKAAGVMENRGKTHGKDQPRDRELLDFWMLNQDGSLSRPKDDNVDVEGETRRILQNSGHYTGEDGLEDNLYSWWRKGGWFGDLDGSGDYREPSVIDDTTSMISMSTNESMEDGGSHSEDEGRRTPTQQDPSGDRSRESSPASESAIDTHLLTRLLNPKSSADRDEARRLAYSLQSRGPLTRSHYQRNINRDRVQLVKGLRKRSIHSSTDQDEEQDLERFILERRSTATCANADTWETGAEGMGAGGPQRFMQPEPSAVPPKETSEPQDYEQTPALQHGPCLNATALDLPSAEPAGTATTTTPAEHLASDTALRVALQESGDGEGSTRPAGRLSAPSTPSPSSGQNRVTEYEKASTPTSRKRCGPGFEVIRKLRSPSDQSSPIQELPNEVLTHTLAHLGPADLTSVALVSKRFHDLVTGPHAWRSAFSHFYPGSASLDETLRDGDDESSDAVRMDRRAFTRLTALASWRSEYIIRTRLLRSLARGKPVQAIASPSATRSGQSHTATPIVMYNSQLFTTVNHLHASFGTGLNKRLPRFIHGADDQGTATTSDPNAGKVDSWGLSDPQLFLQFTDRFPGDEQYGLGPGELVGVPNAMDVSQAYGMIHGEGSPGGMTYFRSTDEMRGRFLLFSSAMSAPPLGIPKIASTSEAICSVWVAKSSTIPSMTEGLIGLLSGSSLGVLTAYSLGSTSTTSNRDQRFGRGEMTARWVLSPGVPLTAIAIDNEYSLKRHAQNRIWAVVLNALGEVFYLTKFPKRPPIDRGTKLDSEAVERFAWLTGRTVYWQVAEPSRRAARPDPYADGSVDGSYSPRSSWSGMCLEKEQIEAETREIEAFVNKKPKDFQRACLGWDMRRRLEVDFAGDDGHNAGENVVVFDCGLDEASTAGIKRYSRCRYQDRRNHDMISTQPLTSDSTQGPDSPSLFGDLPPPPSVAALSFDRLDDALSRNDYSGSVTPRPMSEEWRTTAFSLSGLRQVQILATTMDSSTLAGQTMCEDPLLGFSGHSNASSPSLTPMFPDEPIIDPEDMPGQRARLIAAGTRTGSILLWNIRGSVPKAASETPNTIEPVRLINTDSPQISCLALSSLYLVHGGNDGLVQAWDPLASNMQPIRTLNSRFSSRARRRLAQAQASPQGVGINLFAAGAICLDPDPTVLRGLVSLGTHLRYWSYSSSAADQYKSHKRRLRRSQRGSNNGGERFSGVTRSNLKEYIANETYELDREKEQKKKDAQRLAGRFGTELLDGSEEEMLALAAMLSQETLEQENMRRASTSTVVSSNEHHSETAETAPPTSSASTRQSTPKTEDELDADIAEAIRLSLASSPRAAYDVPFRSGKPKNKKASPTRSDSRPSPNLAGSSRDDEANDLDFALQLSLAEEQSRREVDAAQAEFPALASVERDPGKGKGRAG